MAISLDQFVQSLVSNGLMSEAELADYRGTFPPEKRPKDAESLAFELVRDKRLTKYQVTAILEGSPTGLVLGEYVLQSKIGEGGMGQVFKALHRRLERSAAIKVLRAKSLDSPDAVKRFYQEVRVAARLNHPNIVTTYDASEQDGIHYLAMEYVEGLDLAALVKRDGPMPVVQALDYVIQAASGLQYAHGKGVVHRDVKPSNLLLDTEGTVKILDMGLARVTEPDDVSVGATLAERLTRTSDKNVPDVGYGRLHESGAGHRHPQRRPSVRHLLTRLYALSPVDRQAGIRGRIGGDEADGPLRGSDSLAGGFSCRGTQRAGCGVL